MAECVPDWDCATVPLLSVVPLNCLFYLVACHPALRIPDLTECVSDWVEDTSALRIPDLTECVSDWVEDISALRIPDLTECVSDWVRLDDIINRIKERQTTSSARIHSSS